MGKNKGIIGFVLGIIVAVALYFTDIPGLSHQGHLCLTFSLMTVIFWAFGIAQPGYTSGLYLLFLAVFKVADTKLIFSTWTTQVRDEFPEHHRLHLRAYLHPDTVDPPSLAACLPDHVGHGRRHQECRHPA